MQIAIWRYNNYAYFDFPLCDFLNCVFGPLAQIAIPCCQFSTTLSVGYYTKYFLILQSYYSIVTIRIITKRTTTKLRLKKEKRKYSNKPPKKKGDEIIKLIAFPHLSVFRLNDTESSLTTFCARNLPCFHSQYTKIMSMTDHNSRFFRPRLMLCHDVVVVVSFTVRDVVEVPLVTYSISRYDTFVHFFQNVFVFPQL